MEKRLSEITRAEWIALRWVEITSMGGERTFVADDRRTPDEALQASEEWDVTAEERESVTL